MHRPIKEPTPPPLQQSTIVTSRKVGWVTTQKKDAASAGVGAPVLLPGAPALVLNLVIVNPQ